MALDPVTESLLSITDADRERLMRYQLNWLYYKAHEYLDRLGQKHIQEEQLFRHMRRVFGYVTQCVDADARFTMKRTLRVDADPQFEQDISDLWERSNFQRQKYKLARFAANLGDTFLIVQDIGEGGAVVPRLVVANSEDMTVRHDPDDQTVILWARQSYVFIGEDRKSHTRDWVYFADRIERYTDERMDEGYPKSHPFGEVPVIHIPFLDVGEEYGLCSWHNVLGQVDFVNELGSFANRILLRYADPLLVGSGIAQADTDRKFQRSIKEDNILFLTNADARLQYLEYQGNVLPQAIELVREIAGNIKDQLPELTLAQIRAQSGLSGYAVSLHAAELTAKIDEARGNFANGIEWANSLALRAVRRSGAPLEEFANRVVFENVLPEDEEQKIRIEQGERDLGIVSRRELLRRRGLTDDEIEERLQEVENDRSATGFGLERLNGMFGDLEGGGGVGTE